MRITGYCLKCHKIKYVRVTTLRSSGVPVGTCAACEDKEAKSRGR